LMVKSFFDPAWVDLGILGTFGRWLDVNWVWTEMLIIYHAVFSITIPIVLVELAYLERENERWISNRSLKVFIALLVVVTAIGFLFLTSYAPPLPHYLLTILAMSLFIYIAYKLPTEKEKVESKNGKSKFLYIAGLAGTAAFFLIFWLGPYLFNHPIIVMAFGIALVFGMMKFLNRFDWKSPNSPLNRLAIVAGALSFLIVLTPLQELDATRQDNPAGMTIVGLFAILGLLLLKSKLKARN